MSLGVGGAGGNLNFLFSLAACREAVFVL